MNLHFEDSVGEAASRAVVLLHAFPLDSTMWRDQAADLRSRGFRTVLFDFPGFGSAPSPTSGYALSEIASEVARVVRSLGIENADFVGLSMGGYVMLEIIRLDASLVRSAVLCDTTAAADTDEKREARFETMREIESRGSIVLAEKMLPNLLSTEATHSALALVERLREQFRLVSPKAAIIALRAMAMRRDNSELLHSIDFPTLFVFGEFDTITPPETGVRMCAQTLNSRMVTIAGAGHLSNLERPREFTVALADFLTTEKP